MGKRKVVVVVSSDDEDEDGGVPATGDPASAGPRPSSASAVRKRLRGERSKKSDSCSNVRPANPSREAEAVKFDALSEKFSECLHDFGGLTGLKHTNGDGLWVDKHKPFSLAELAVHKKKVEEVKNWLEERLKNPKDEFSSCVLLITGQAGVGKSAAVRVIASQLEADLCEWTTPTPTLWKEHVHTTNSGMRYVSKLEEFETFVEKIRKYGLLRPTHTKGSHKPLILLIDDLPLTNGRVQFLRLSKCLATLANSTKVPTVILITEYHRTESGSSSPHSREDLKASLELAGAYKVALNPITVNSVKRVLSRICQEEKCDVTSEWLDYIAKASGGDIRHAITSLQYCCLRPTNSFPSALPTEPASCHKIDADKSSTLSLSCHAQDLLGSMTLPFGRDETLSLFHALGKFLHNKRDTVDPFTPGPTSLILQDQFARNPLKMDAPEKIISQSHGQARSIVDFLHENVLDFIHDEAIDDAWMVASYLSEVDCLLGKALPKTRHLTIGGSYELETITQAIAASVAVRGVLFGNSRPSPPRWHSIRSPRLWQIERSSWGNKNQMLMERDKSYSMSSACNMSILATEYRPRSKWLRCQTSGSDFTAHVNSYQCPIREDDGSDHAGPDNLETINLSEETEDEIEDF